MSKHKDQQDELAGKLGKETSSAPNVPYTHSEPMEEEIDMLAKVWGWIIEEHEERTGERLL